MGTNDAGLVKVAAAPAVSVPVPWEIVLFTEFAIEALRNVHAFVHACASYMPR